MFEGAARCAGLVSHCSTCAWSADVGLRSHEPLLGTTLVLAFAAGTRNVRDRASVALPEWLGAIASAAILDVAV